MYKKGNNARLKFSPPEIKTKSYRADYIRKRMLQKSFKGNEKGFKTLGKLPDTLHTGIEVLWRQNMMCDIELVTPDRKHLQAHKIVLATCCDYFYDIFCEDTTRELSFQIEVPELSGKILETIVEAMYTGKVKIEALNVDDLLSAAHTLGIFVVMDACEDFLLEYISKENCLQLLGTAFKYNLTNLTDVSLEIAAKNFKSISKRQLFKNLPVEHLVPMLKRNDLEVSNELEVFQQVRIWIEINKQSRLQHAAEVFSTIRLPLLTPAEIVDNVEVCSYLMDITECQNLVQEALHYHLMPARQCLLQSPRTLPRLKSEMSVIAIGGAPRMKNDVVCDDIMKLNHVTNKWDHVTKLPEPRHHHGVAVLNGFLYVAGGEVRNETCSPVDTVHRFDPRDLTWTHVTSMLHCRQSFQLGVLNGALYAVGGRIDQDNSLSSVERYDPGLDRWQEVAELSSPRRCVAVGSLAGKLYAVGGSGSTTISSRVERYTPYDNTWEIIKPILTPRFFGHLLNVNNNLHIVGGATINLQGHVICVDTIERYSKENNQWTALTKMRTPRSESGCCVINEKIYVMGGYNWNANERLSDVECFDTDTQSWTVLPKLEQPLTGIAAASITWFERKKRVSIDENFVKDTSKTPGDTTEKFNARKS